MIIKVSVKKLRALCDPTLDWPWDDYDCRDHLSIISHFVKNGIDEPISVDVGIPSLGYDGPSWPILDGNHRFYAAILRCDKTILAEISGEIDYGVYILQ